MKLKLSTGSCDSAIKGVFFQLVLASGTGRRSSNSLRRRGSGHRVMSCDMNSGPNRPLQPPAVAAEMLCSGSKFPIQNRELIWCLCVGVATRQLDRHTTYQRKEACDVGRATTTQTNKRTKRTSPHEIHGRDRPR